MSKIDLFVEGNKDGFSPKNWLPRSEDEQQLPKRKAETHIDILIAGAGFVGLMMALEYWRKGYNIVGIGEQNKGPNYSGKLSLLPL